ncbi:MAG: PaaI family thioesterase [Desulfosarcina sp.]|nr:PaaI family thioesterase [Desulfobacterales bacterium]
MASKYNYKHIFERAKHVPARNLLGAHLLEVDEGVARVCLPFRPELGNYFGAIQGGILTAVADMAGGWALLTLSPPKTLIVTVEIKLNFLKPSKEEVRADGQVIQLGANLGISSLSIVTLSGKRIAVGIGTYFLKPDLTEKGQKDYYEP